MHPVVGAQIAGRRERKGSVEDFICYGENRSEHGTDLRSQPGEVAEDPPQLQMPELLQNRHGRLSIHLSARHSFKNTSAGIPVARARRRVNDDVGIDEEQLLEAPFHELVEFVRGNVAGASRDYRSIGLLFAPFWLSSEVLVDGLSNKGGDRRFAPPRLVLKTAPLFRRQKDLQPFAVHTHSIHISC